MPDLPTKEEIVGRAHCQTALSTSRASVARALDALTIGDLLALLMERGCKVDFSSRAAKQSRALTVVLPEETPDAMS